MTTETNDQPVERVELVGIGDALDACYDAMALEDVDAFRSTVVRLHTHAASLLHLVATR